MIKNGLLMNDPNIIPVNIFGFILNLIYFLVFYFFTADSVNILLLFFHNLCLSKYYNDYIFIETTIVNVN